jgi:hypothetical protein
MRRPSYLQQVAAPPPRRGVVVLAPPRIAFRPGAAELTVEDVRTPAAAASRAPVRAAPQVTGPAATRTVEVPGPVVAPRVPSVAQALREAAAAATSVSRGDSATAERGGPTPQPTPIAPPGQPPLAGRVATAPGAAAAPPSPSPIAPPRLEPGLAQPGRRAASEALATPAEVRPARPAEATASARPAAPLEPPPALPRASIELSSASPREIAPPPPPIAPSAAPPPSAPAAALPLITPPPPPPRAPVPAARERAPPGLHIGTLEVRIVAPAPPPASFALQRPAPSRAARGPAVRSGGIARGFSVFGLGQS